MFQSVFNIKRFQIIHKTKDFKTLGVLVSARLWLAKFVVRIYADDNCSFSGLVCSVAS